MYNNYWEIILYINLNDPHGDNDKKDFVTSNTKTIINCPREPQEYTYKIIFRSRGQAS